MGSSKKKPGAPSGGAHSNLPPEVAAAKAELIDVESKRTTLVEELRLVEKQVRLIGELKTSFFFLLLRFDLLSLFLALFFSTPSLQTKTKTDLRPRDALPCHGQPGRNRPQGLRRPPFLLRGGRRRRRRRRWRRRSREEARGCQGRGAAVFPFEHHRAAPRGEVKRGKKM